MTEAELINDPSLRWCPYRRWELLWSDLHQTEVRFLEYRGDLVAVATLNGIAPYPEPHPTRLQVRRKSAHEREALTDAEKRRVLNARADSKKGKP